MAGMGPTGFFMPICDHCERALWKIRGELVHRFNSDPVCVPGNGTTATPRPPATVDNIPESNDGLR